MTFVLFYEEKTTTWFGLEIRNLPKLKGHCHFESRVRLPETYIIFYAFIAIYTGKGNSYDRLHNLSSFLWWLGVFHIMSNNRFNRGVHLWWAFIVVSFITYLDILSHSTKNRIVLNFMTNVSFKVKSLKGRQTEWILSKEFHVFLHL